jgi:hypothetical protein
MISELSSVFWTVWEWRPLRVVRLTLKWILGQEKYLENLKQLLLLTLCPNLNRIWIQILIHSKGFEFELISNWLQEIDSNFGPLLIVKAQSTWLETCNVIVVYYNYFLCALNTPLESCRHIRHPFWTATYHRWVSSELTLIWIASEWPRECVYDETRGPDADEISAA